MTLAADLPAYFPSLNFFYKLCLADVFVVADDLQFSKHGSINRARIKTASGPAWLTVPVLTKGLGSQAINRVSINTNRNWTQTHLRTLFVNYKYAAYFEAYENFLADLYVKKRWKWLSNLNLRAIEFFAKELNLKTKTLLGSDLQIREKGAQWVLATLERTACRTYLVEKKLEDYLTPVFSNRREFSLNLLREPRCRYHQQFEGFSPGLSILDLLLNEGPESRKILMNTEC